MKSVSRHGWIALLCVFFLSCSSAYALGIDIPRPKKDKEKKADKGKTETKSEDKKDEGKKDEVRSTPPPEGAKTEELWAEVKKDVEPIVDKTMDAFNAKDWKTFWAAFPEETRNNKDTTDALNRGYGMFRDSWGAYKSRVLVKERGNPDYFSFGKLSYDVEFEKQKGRMEINFKKLNNQFTLLALTLQNPDGSFAQPGNVQVGNNVVMGAGGVVEMKLPKSLWAQTKDFYKAGDWVEYEMPAVPGYKSRQEVVEVGDNFVVLDTKTTMAGQTTQQKSKMSYTEPDPPEQKTEEEEKQKVEKKEFADKVTVKDKGEVAATRHEMYLNGKLVSKSWVSKDLPLGGMVKTEDADGKVLQVMTAYGRK
jgi:hypothetical protein